MAPKNPPPEPEEEESQVGGQDEEGSEREGEEEEHEEESESTEHSNSIFDLVIVPVSTSKSTAQDSKPASKHPSEGQKDYQGDARSKKKAKIDADELKKNNLSVVSSAAAATSGGRGARRVWNDDDVIDLLECMIVYKDEKGVDPTADMISFCEFVKGKLRIEFSKNQIYEKIRGLRKKFLNLKKSHKDGKDDAFANTEAFALADEILGGEIGNIANVARKGGEQVSSADIIQVVKNKDNVLKELVGDVNDDFKSKYPFLCQSFALDLRLPMRFTGSFLKENMSSIDDAKAKELEGRWKKLREDEVELLQEKLDLMTNHIKLVLEGLKRND